MLENVSSGYACTDYIALAIYWHLAYMSELIYD